MSDIREFSHGDEVAITLVGTVTSTRYGAELRVSDQPYPNVLPGWIFSAAVDAYKIEPPTPEFTPGTLVKDQNGKVYMAVDSLEGDFRSIRMPDGRPTAGMHYAYRDFERRNILPLVPLELVHA